MEQNRGTWGSNLGFVLAAIGSAVGMGNLWGFPYKMGANGGFPFLVIYLILVITCGVVVMGVEMTIGRNTKKSPILALAALGKKNKFVGVFGVACSFLIMGFYSILIGYAFRYFFGFGAEMFGISGFAGLSGGDFFGVFTGNVGGVIGYTALTFILCALIVASGVRGGIERFNLIGIPALFLILIGIIIYGLTLPGSGQGLTFMFSSKGMEMVGTDFNFFTALRVAGGQMLFSLSLGMGCMITYGSYMEDKSNISKNAWIVPAADTMAALLAGLAIFPVVFAMGQNPAGGPGLLFITMHNTFVSMGSIGNLIGTLFYLLVIFAGMSSAVSLMEVASANFIDIAVEKKKPGNRKKNVLIVTAVMFLMSIPVCIDQLGGNTWAVSKMYGFLAAGSQDLLDLYDFLAEGILMPLGSILMCYIVGWKMGIPWMKAEIEKGGNKFHTSRFFTVCVKYVTPVLMTFVLFSLALSYLGI